MFSQIALINQMDSLRKFSLRLTRNVHDADDLLQSTVLRALEKRHLFEPDTNLFSWMSKIMYNLFVSDYRRRVKFETQYDPETHIQSQSVAPSQDIKVELQQVDRAMQEMSADHREILFMVCVKGIQYAEVSDLLHIPVGTVRSRLSRARENLQDVLNAGWKGHVPQNNISSDTRMAA